MGRREGRVERRWNACSGSRVSDRKYDKRGGERVREGREKRKGG